MRWFVDQLRLAEEILSNALEKSENFSEHDKLIISKIRREVDMADLTLLQLLSPIAPLWAMGSEHWYHIKNQRQQSPNMCPIQIVYELVHFESVN